MQSTIKSTKTRPAQVLDAELMAASNDVRMELSKRESLRRELRRWKRGVQPPEPATLASVNLPDEPTLRLFLVCKTCLTTLVRRTSTASPDR